MVDCRSTTPHGDALNLSHLIAYFGSPSKVAAWAGVSGSAISHWRKRGVPLRVALAAERYTCGVLKVTLAAIWHRYSP